MNTKFYVQVLVSFLTIALSWGYFVSGETGNGKDYWPKESWRISTPEEQGMDSGAILKMLNYIISQQQNYHSILIIRNGYLITEAYFHPYHRMVKQNVQSCANSVTSALTGIAIREGYIKDIHQKVVDFFPEYPIANLYDNKKSMTIEHLLMMNSALELRWNVMSAASTNLVYTAPDPVKFVLDLPMLGDPGQYFYFNYGVPHVLGTILQKTSGENLATLAQQHLFDPLGITDPDWAADSQGRNWGGAGLCMTPIDMAKFGYLYLRRGVWNGVQIVPARWVEASTRQQIDWEPSFSKRYGYGYLWWVEPYGFAAWGLGGQYIGVFPQLDMVVVLTGGIKEDLVIRSLVQPLMETFVIPAVKSNRPLPENPKINQQLNTLLRELAAPKSRPVPPLPALAARISGKVMLCEPNDLHFQSVSLLFERGKQCRLSVNLQHWNHSGKATQFEIPVGLDGVYRTGYFPESGLVALKGSWISADTFAIQWQDLRRPECLEVRLRFHKERAHVEVTGAELDFLRDIQSDYKCKVM